MNFAGIQSIKIAEDRMRREFDEDALQELMASILSKGLMHAPVVQRRTNEDSFELIAGERRLRAMTKLHAQGSKFNYNGGEVPKDCVPYVLVHDTLSPYLVAEAEFEENVMRKDLTWQEQVEARNKLFKLRKLKAEEAGEVYDGVRFAADLQASGLSEASVATVHRELRVAAHLNNPEIKGAKTVQDAQKLVKKEREAFLLEALGETLAKGPPPKHELLIGDCLDVIPALPGNVYDCIVTDPPYGIDIQDSGSMVEHEHHYDDSPEVLEGILERLPFHLYRITRGAAHLYWFCDLRWFPKISFALEEAGFIVYYRPIIWWKRGKAMVPDYVRWPKREYECILFANKGDKPLHKVAGDVISTPYGSDLQQAEKPKELYVELLSRSCLAGSKVIDPFCGTGVVFEAAEELKLSATGIELDKERAAHAKLKAHGI